MLVGLIIELSNHQVIQSVIGYASKPTSSATKQPNFIINQTSLYLSCIRLIKVSRPLYINNSNGDPDKIYTSDEILHTRDQVEWLTCHQTTVYVKYSRKSSVRSYKPNRGHAPQRFSNSNGGGRDRLRRRSTSRRRSHWGQSLVATSAAGPQPGPLLYVRDRESKLRFLVDTGSELGNIPPSMAERANRQDTFGLVAANNSPIVTYRTVVTWLRSSSKHEANNALTWSLTRSQ